MIAQTFGGIGLFLLGMILMTEGLKSLAGDALRRVLGLATGGPISAALTGAGATALVQSSSATTLMTIGFVSAGLLTLTQAIGVIIGANIGTTSTGWIVSVLGLKLQIAAFALPAVGAGALLRLLTRDRWAAGGQALAGFGLIFLGIDILQEGMASLSDHFNPQSFPGAGFPGRLLLVLIGALMTVVMQSSSAAVATTLTALAAGNIQFEQAAALVIGQNIGTTVTAAIGSIGGSTPARRTALAHILFNVGTAAIAIALMSPAARLTERIMSPWEEAPGPLAIALFHTLFNAGGALLFLPLVTPYARMIQRILPERGPNLTRWLDPNVARTGGVAIDVARRTVMAITAETITDLRRFLDDADAHRLGVELEAVNSAVHETRRFLASVRTGSESRTMRQRHLAILHALDHLDRLVDSARDTTNARHAATTPELRDLMRQMSDEFDATEAWFDDPSKPAPLSELERMSKSIAETRRAHRPRILEQTAAGVLTPDDADAQLEACRWIDGLGYHVWRTVLHLREEPPAQATSTAASDASEVHADPARSA